MDGRSPSCICSTVSMPCLCMKPSRLFVWFVAWIPCSLFAALPKSVVVTDDLVTINGIVIAARNPKQEFHISRDRIVAVVGQPTTVNKSWFTSECGWKNLGIGLQYRGDIQQCTTLTFSLRREPYLETFWRPYTGAISVSGVPITSLTDPAVFRKIGFKKSYEGYSRTIGNRETALWVDTHGHITRDIIELPKKVDRSID